jgi:uncharacterized protein
MSRSPPTRRGIGAGNCLKPSGISANRRARINAVKSGAPLTLTSRADLRDLLRGAGLSRAAAEKVATAGWSALASSDPEAEAKAAELVAAIRATALAIKGA